VKKKDINDMAYRMFTSEIKKLIDENTLRGLQTTAWFRNWSKER